MMRFACIHNPQSGTAQSAKEIVKSFESAGSQVDCYDIQKGSDALTPIIKKGKYTAVVAAGGDGTVNMVAGIAIKLSLPLGVLPVGTLNHFAKDIGLPLAFEGAVQVICFGDLQAVDYCTVNDKVFLNNASIGIYPSVVLDRDNKKYFSKMLATATAFITALFRDHTLRAVVATDTFETSVRSPLLFIGNNRYELERIGFTKRSNITSGKLFLYIVKATRSRSLILLALLSLIGMRRRHVDVMRETTRPITINSQQQHVLVAVDGEIIRLDSPLTFSMHAASLKVYVGAENS
jgi:diacylglycerol kinase family enzyme